MAVDPSMQRVDSAGAAAPIEFTLNGR